MQWILIIFFSSGYNGSETTDTLTLEGFKTREACLSASTSMNVLLIDKAYAATTQTRIRQACVSVPVGVHVAD